MELFALIKASSGEDYGHDPYSYTPEPDIIGLFSTKVDALKAMEDEVEDILTDCEEDEEVEVDDTLNQYRVITNKDSDYCIVLKVESVSLQK